MPQIPLHFHRNTTLYDNSEEGQEEIGELEIQQRATVVVSCNSCFAVEEALTPIIFSIIA